MLFLTLKDHSDEQNFPHKFTVQRGTGKYNSEKHNVLTVKKKVFQEKLRLITVKYLPKNPSRMKKNVYLLNMRKTV
jgi:hypothetical protein